MSNQEYEACRQAIFQAAGEEAPCLPPYEGGCAVTQAGDSEGVVINLPSPPNLSFGVEPQGLAPGLQQGVPGPPQALGLAGPPQAPGVGVLAPPWLLCKSPSHGGAVGGGGGTQALGPFSTESNPQDYSGISSALKQLAHIITDANTAHNLRWQQDIDGDNQKINVWKVEVAALPRLQFYAYMQPGDPFLVVGHSLSIIYSTATDVASFHGKMVLFTGDRKVTCDCAPVFLPAQSAFKWKTCTAIDNKTKLRNWYADNPAEYGKLWDPTQANGTKVDLKVPCMIGLPLQVAKLYHDQKGAVMPHKLLQAMEDHLALTME
jgi:hypothetical protein